MTFLRAQIQQEGQEQLHQNACGGGLPAQGPHGFEQPVGASGHQQTEQRAAQEGDHEFAGGLPHGEFSGEGGGQSELEADDAGSVIEE